MINNNYSRKDHCNDHRKSFYTKAPPFRVAPNIRYQPEPNCSQPQIPQEEIENCYIFKLDCPNMRNIIIKILPSNDLQVFSKLTFEVSLTGSKITFCTIFPFYFTDAHFFRSAQSESII